QLGRENRGSLLWRQEPVPSFEDELDRQRMLGGRDARLVETPRVDEEHITSGYLRRSNLARLDLGSGKGGSPSGVVLAEVQHLAVFVHAVEIVTGGLVEPLYEGEGAIDPVRCEQDPGIHGPVEAEQLGVHVPGGLERRIREDVEVVQV